jgi:hypothetical protein
MEKKLRASLLTVAAAAIAGSMAAGAARADWLVTRDGVRIETKGAWRVDGRRVLFTMPNGTLSTIRTDEVNLDQSALATTQARDAAVAPLPAAAEKKEPVLRLTDKDIARSSITEEGAEAKKDETKADVASPLEVISWEKTEDSTGDGLEIFGTIKNGGANIITTPTLLVAIYDADGGLLATNNGDVNSPQILAGKTANFRVSFPGITDFASVKFDAQGRGWKPRVENAEVEETEAPESDDMSETPVEPEPEPEMEEPPPSF